ncbi:MAG TPA: cytochrome P450 [Streptosporangiaceae bacterium]|nr:cytochrome P450 [Streptosporangiaceae bacterium]
MSESLGDLYDPFGTHMDDPWPFYTRAQRETPIFFSPVLKAWVLTRLDDVRKVLRDGKTYSSANVLRPLAPFSPRVFPVLASGYPMVPPLLMLDGEQHRRQRAPYADALSADHVHDLEPYITKQAAALIDKFTAGGPTADLVADYANPLPTSIICHLMGFAPEDHDTLGDDTRLAAGLAMGHRFDSEDEQVEAAHAWVRSQRMIGRYAVERRAKPEGDLLSHVVAAWAPGEDPLTPQQEAGIAGELFGVIIAGHNTPSAAIADGLLRLLEDPERWRLLCDRPDLIPNAVEEIARFSTPFHIFLRKTTEDTTLAGRELPAGAEIAVWLAAANRDESVFERANEFDITRPITGSHLGFGVGAHFCVGAGLARRELEITLRLLTERLPGLRLVPDQRISFCPSISQRGPLSLPVTW